MPHVASFRESWFLEVPGYPSEGSLGTWWGRKCKIILKELTGLTRRFHRHPTWWVWSAILHVMIFGLLSSNPEIFPEILNLNYHHNLWSTRAPQVPQMAFYSFPGPLWAIFKISGKFFPKYFGDFKISEADVSTISPDFPYSSAF